MYIVPPHSSGYRRGGLLGYLDYLYKDVILIYIIPLLSFSIFAMVTLSTVKIPDITAMILPVIPYIWGATLVLILALISVFAYKRLERMSHPKLVVVGISIIGLFSIVGLLNLIGLVPLSVTPEPTYFFSAGSSYTCPSGADYYGTSGCQYQIVGNAGTNGVSPTSTSLASAGQTVTCPSGNYFSSTTLYAAGYTFTCGGTSCIVSATGSNIIILSKGQTYTLPSNEDITTYWTVSQCSMQYEVPSTSTSSTVTTTFTESGLPGQYNGNSVYWQVTYNGASSFAAAGAPITFTTATGSYSFSISIYQPSGMAYSPSPSSGSLSAGSSQSITFSQQTTTSSTSCLVYENGPSGAQPVIVSNGQTFTCPSGLVSVTSCTVGSTTFQPGQSFTCNSGAVSSVTSPTLEGTLNTQISLISAIPLAILGFLHI